jgi:hypothetical protein
MGRRTYPDTGPFAILARLAFPLSTAGLVFATLAPGATVPQLIYSNNLEHFAAFYVVALSAAVALPRASLRSLLVGMAVFAMLLESARLLTGENLDILEKWCADVGGVLAAYAPMVGERFRQLFPKNPDAAPPAD